MNPKVIYSEFGPSNINQKFYGSRVDQNLHVTGFQLEEQMMEIT